MIIGIGIDIIELDRIANSLAKNRRIITRILTADEQKQFQNLNSDQRKVEFLAGRFAAKEAFAKATGEGIGKLSFQHINVLTSAKGAPTIQVEGFEDKNVFLSITHSRDYAVSQVIIEQQ